MKTKPKIKHKSLKTLRKTAWRLQSEYIRKSAADEHGLVRCYTCSRPHYWTDMELGHYIHRDCLDYTKDNLRVQCNFCNRRLHGNSGVFAENLIKEIGYQRVEALRQAANKIKKFTVEELEELILTYKQSAESK